LRSLFFWDSSIAQAPDTLSALARRLSIGTGTLKSWVDRVADFVCVREGIYQINDPCLALWLKSKSEMKPILPPLVLGDEAEQTVARKMAAAGFELIYQSKASRGGFDLLAILQTREVGVQVKKTTFPFYLRREELQLMQFWGEKLGWTPLLALIVENNLHFYAVADWQADGESYRVDADTSTISNLLTLCSTGC
jgi:Holliday junction resolvase